VYSHPVLGYEAVKKGFSWPAFFFTWVWAFIKKLWIPGIGIFVALLVVIVIQDVSAQKHAEFMVFIAFLAQLGMQYWVGENGNSWRAESMIERGFSLIAGSAASTPDAAIAEISRAAKSDAGDLAEGAIEDSTLDKVEKRKLHEERSVQDEKDVHDEREKYQLIADEMDNDKMDRAIWIRALGESGGDENKQRAIYVKLRMLDLSRS
jgi:hypothetical protein